MTDETLPPPVVRSPLYEEVAEGLRRFIVERGLRPGDRLPSERDLSQSLQVSRTSVRQAITVLRVMGLVSVRHGDGVFVLRTGEDTIPPIAPDVLRSHPELRHINEVREGLESQAARLAARRRTDSDLLRIRAALSLMAAEISGEKPGREGDRHLHEAIVAASRSPLLASMLSQLREGIDEISQASLARPGQAERSLATHTEIVDAIERRDEQAAHQLMLSHLVVTGQVQEEQDAPREEGGSAR